MMYRRRQSSPIVAIIACVDLLDEVAQCFRNVFPGVSIRLEQWRSLDSNLGITSIPTLLRN
jgi:hypothetical protein